MKGTVHLMPGDRILSPANEKGCVAVPLVGAVAGVNVERQVLCGQLDLDEVPDLSTVCKEFSRSVCVDAKVEKSLTKSNTFPVTKELKPCSLPSNSTEGSPGAAGDGQSSSASGPSAYARSVSLPTSSLISAMKGGRAANGTSPRSELHVKWSPEVYDPPATSMSHTVTSHQRPKAKKKDKYKHKGRSSRGNGNGGKHGNRKSNNRAHDSPNARLQGNCEKLVLNGLHKPEMVEIYDYGSQEMNCGTSFLREALPKMHLSIGEAS